MAAARSASALQPERHFWLFGLLAALCCLLSACETVPKSSVARGADSARLSADRDQLAAQLRALGPATDAGEARRIAAVTVQTGQDLALKYGVGRSPNFHNALVNFGFRQRGLCWHWAVDLAKELVPLQPRAFDFHWAVANEDRLTEHNVIVVTARGAAMEYGLVLDLWRAAGFLTSFPVKADPKYRWFERSPPDQAPRLSRE